MMSNALVPIAFLLVFSVFAEGSSRNGLKDDEPLHTNTYFGGYGSGGGTAGGGGGGASGGSSGGGAAGSGSSGGGAGGGGSSGGGAAGGGPGGYSSGFSHGGVYGGGKICKWGCCSESYGYSHPGGGYYSCTCCATAAEAKAYQQTQPKSAQTKN